MLEHIIEMKALTWKEVFASLNPSPIFEAVAMLAEDLAIKDDESCKQEVRYELPCRAPNRSSGKLEGAKPRTRLTSKRSSKKVASGTR